MPTLSNLTLSGWIARDGDFRTLPCDTCDGKATFVRMDAPDCSAWCLAGVGGSRSDVYGIFCGTCA